MIGLNILISHSSTYKKAGWGRIFPLAEGMVTSHNSVTIITSNPRFSILRKVEIINGVKVIVFPEIIPIKFTKLGFGFLSLLLKVLYVIFRKFDVVHTDNGHRPLAGIPARLHKRFHGSVYVAEWYDWYGIGGQYDTKPRLFKLIFGKYELKYEIKDKMIADGVVVLSELLRRRAETFKESSKIIKIHGGADITSIPYITENTGVKRKFDIDSNMFTFGYIDAFTGNLNEIQPLIDAIICAKLEDNVKILLFGSSTNIENLLDEQSRKLIINFGWVDYAKDFEKLQCVDVFFTFKKDLLGNRAGWPNCIGDYLACGRPVFLNPIGEVVEFVENHPDGFFLASLSTESISSLLPVIVNNPERLKEMGRYNRLVAEQEISWQIKSDMLLSFYSFLLKHK